MGMPSSAKNEATLSRLWTLPQPVETNSTPTVRRATSRATQSSFLASATARSPNEKKAFIDVFPFHTSAGGAALPSTMGARDRRLESIVEHLVTCEQLAQPRIGSVSAELHGSFG